VVIGGWRLEGLRIGSGGLSVESRGGGSRDLDLPAHGGGICTFISSSHITTPVTKNRACGVNARAAP
jgi:hypothetical protein